MFKHLTDFGYKRNVQEAIGFYIVYLILIVLAGGIVGTITGLVVDASNAYNISFSLGVLTAILITLTLSFFIITKKKKTSNYVFIGLALLAGVLAYFGGGLLGLIPVAYLTTKK